MKPKIMGEPLRIAVCLLIVAGFVRGEQIKLARSAVPIDFKEEGYYKTIPFIALRDDRFFISDCFTHRVLEYRWDGKGLEFLRAIGRPGQGPGDLMLPNDISISGDTLAVHDEFGISFFGFDGIFKGKFPLLSKSVTMLFADGFVFCVNYDSTKKDLIQSFHPSGGVRNSFLEKSSLYPLRPEIQRGLTSDSLERIVYEGILLSSGGELFYLNTRFGDVWKSDLSGTNITKRNIGALLSKVEKAKAYENRRMFLDEGFDLDANQRMIPVNNLFTDARIWNGRLFLLMENYDILEKKWKPYLEIVEIDLASWSVVRTYRADTAAKFETAFNFLVLGKGPSPDFLMTIRVPEEDMTLFLFKPEK